MHTSGHNNEPYEIWGFHSRESSDFGLLGCDTMYFCRWLPYKTTWCHSPEDQNLNDNEPLVL
jgi:hypothetical protein